MLRRPMPKYSLSRGPFLSIAVNEPISCDEIIAIIREHYPTLGNLSVLWDFSAIDVGYLTSKDFEQIVAAASAVTPRGCTRKLAYVVADQRSYSVAWKYINAAFSARLPAEYAVFTTANRAVEWLQQAH